MTTIKATCPDCGEVALTPEDVELRVDRSGADASFYAFTCPSCDELVRKPADERVIRLLISGGVPALAAREPYPERKADGPRFSHDDLLDFHALLRDDTWFEALLTATRQSS